MEEIDFGWLISTTLQIIGLAIGLAVLGFSYERAIREKKSILYGLEHGHQVRWLAFSGIIFAVGMIFTQASWGYKLIAIALGALLIGLAVTSSQSKLAYKDQIVRKSIIKKSLRKRLTPIFIGIVLLGVIGWGIHLGYHGIHLLNLARSLQNNTTQLQPENIIPVIGEASNDISAIHQDLRPIFPILNALHGLPMVGPYLNQIRPLIIFADNMAQAGKEIVLGLEPLLNETSTGQAALSLSERASQTLQLGQNHFANATIAIEEANQVRSQITPELLPDSVRPMYQKLDENFNLLVAGARLLQSAPQLLGNEKAQNYLILAQNRDELRATGGFISGIGMLTIQEGKILQFTLGDSYAVDDFSKPYPAPPEALKRFMLADYWVTRDANWSPDFPTSAKEAQALYTLSTGVQTEGVIAFNQLMVKRILEAIGPVQVPGTEKAVTAENVEKYMSEAWAPEPEEGLSQEWWLHRKDFMQQLGSVILEKVLLSNDQDQLVELGKTMIDLLEEGQLLVYLNDTTAQEALMEGELDGAVKPGSGDYLYVVDSNIGFNKVDSVIQRSFAYQVDLTDMDHPKGQVTLTYQHTGTGNKPCEQVASYGNGTYQDMQQRCYWDYWRLFTPSSSELLSSTAQAVSGKELLNTEGWSGQVESLIGEANTHVFAGLIVLPISKSTQVDVSYSLPPSIVDTSGRNQEEYTLQVDVQPGLQGIPFQLTVINPNADLLFLDAGWKSTDSGTWTWQGVLDKPIELKLRFSQRP